MRLLMSLFGFFIPVFIINPGFSGPAPLSAELSTGCNQTPWICEPLLSNTVIQWSYVWVGNCSQCSDTHYCATDLTLWPFHRFSVCVHGLTFRWGCVDSWGLSQSLLGLRVTSSLCAALQMTRHMWGLVKAHRAVHSLCPFIKFRASQCLLLAPVHITILR